MPRLTILIADDHPLIRRGVRELLSTRPEWQIVGEASDGAEAIQKVFSLKPDVAILDFSMPELNGSEVAALIVRNAPETGIVVLTMHDSDGVIHQVLRSGARGLVLKGDADRTLLAAVEAVAERRHYYTARASELVLGGYLTGKVTTEPGGANSEPQLTEREEEVLRLLADGMTSKEAAAELQISVRTVESHRINISRKCGFSSIADLIHYAIRKGIVTHS